MSAAGRVCTGFSKPYIANYAESSGTITYSNGQLLARGVDVNISPDAAAENIFHADNAEAERDNRFTGGTLTATVDGLLPTAERMLSQLPAPVDDWYVYDDDQGNGYFGFGFIGRYMSDGVTSYVPYVLLKVSFDPIQTSAATQESEISWQTQSLSGKILRAGDAKHGWKNVGIEYPTEAAAEAALRTRLGISG